MVIPTNHDLAGSRDETRGMGAGAPAMPSARNAVCVLSECAPGNGFVFGYGCAQQGILSVDQK